MQPKPHGGGAVALIRKEHLPIVEALVTNQPDALLEELCERFAKQTAVVVSVSTMQRAVRGLKLSVKKKTPQPMSKTLNESRICGLLIGCGVSPSIHATWCSLMKRAFI